MSLVLFSETENMQKNGWNKIVEKLRIFCRNKHTFLIIKGVLATCLAFLGATIAIQRKNNVLANRMFRYRIYAQGFTLAIMIAGNIYYRTIKQKNS
ncbi:hypothetical protein PMAC_002732 [Pneumocystis sp. 'macacae']|nr:hypothetical protein PMAC_002732 [Pneumocystis sp. 'macacae']